MEYDYSVLPQLSSATLQQRFNLAYPELVSQHDAFSSLKGIPRLVDRGSVAVASTPLTLQAPRKPAAATEEQQQEKEKEQDPQEEDVDDDDDDDHPHHDEDNQMKRNDVHYLLKQLNSFSDIEEIEIVDMKQRPQRPQPMASSSLATIMLPTAEASAAAAASATSPTSQSHRLVHRSGDSSLVLPNQFDDYLFESCHYLETNYFAATYRTAMVESSSHEFRPSTNSSSNSCFELHEMEPPSVICKAGAPPPRYQFEYQAETRLTTSGVQTELTVESLAKLSKSSSSSSSSPRAPPFFRCCYTPIDRWRERRQQQKQSSSSAGTTQPPKDV